MPGIREGEDPVHLSLIERRAVEARAYAVCLPKEARVSLAEIRQNPLECGDATVAQVSPLPGAVARGLVIEPVILEETDKEDAREDEVGGFRRKEPLDLRHVGPQVEAGPLRKTRQALDGKP
jgi:hypothetical protein